MINAYLWGTPNGQKLSIMLEECGLPYSLRLVNIGKGEQHEPSFRAINPNGKIPAIVDTDGPGGHSQTVFESGAILIYLAEKSGKFLSTDPSRRIETIEWLMFQMAGVGPMFGQAGFFLRQPEKIPVAIDRYTGEARRLLGVLDERLGKEEYLAGEYSIADIATWPWINGTHYFGISLDEYPNVKRWHSAIGARPAVQRGLELTKV